MILASLPNDVWMNIASCLTGPDLLELVVVDRWTRQYFSHDQFWSWRLTFDEKQAIQSNSSTSSNAVGEEQQEEAGRLSAIQLYVRAFSLKFQGLHKHGLPSRGSCAKVIPFFNKRNRQAYPFTIEVRFCLLSDTKDEIATHPGGILFGAQSSSYESPQWAHYHQQFVVVSSDRKLFCSVVDQKPEIASDLEFNRWYHLALTYGNRTQRVYLDGQLKSTLTADLHHECSALRYAQVGTGCITAGAMNFPKPRNCGWYSFNGLIDDFRVWNAELSSDRVQALALGSTQTLLPELLYYSLKRDLGVFPPKKTTRVSCSRPSETIAVSRRSNASIQQSRKREPALLSDGAQYKQPRLM